MNIQDPFFPFRWIVTSFPLPINLSYVEKVSIPFDRYESIPVYVAGKNTYYHSTYDIDSIDITFYEDDSLSILSMLNDWQKIIQDKGYYGLPKDYKKSFEVSLLSNSSGSPVANFKVIGAWPSAIGNVELAYSDSERLIVTATFTIDMIERIFTKNGGESDWKSGSTPNGFVTSNATNSIKSEQYETNVPMDSNNNVPPTSDIINGVTKDSKSLNLWNGYNPPEMSSVNTSPSVSYSVSDPSVASMNPSIYDNTSANSEDYENSSINGYNPDNLNQIENAAVSPKTIINNDVGYPINETTKNDAPQPNVMYYFDPNNEEYTGKKYNSIGLFSFSGKQENTLPSTEEVDVTTEP